jgi:hydrogenase maturation protein HypF
MSQHIGDMANLETLAAFDAARAHLQQLFRIAPRVVACDRHPGYLSTVWAREFTAREGLPLVRVQHHHAHIAALMAERRLDGGTPVLGICFDGAGYGDDGAIWGGEALIADYRGFRRVAHLAYVPQPGGDLAVRRPYRMALAHLWAAGIAWNEDLAPVAACPLSERRVLAQQLRANLNCAPTSSMGRLFDAVAALIGVQQHAAYEAQAAIEMESLADPEATADCAFGIDETLRIDPAPVLRALIDGKRAGAPVALLAGRFHAAVADLVLALCERLHAVSGLRMAALSGGVFQNTLLLKLCVQRLRLRGFSVLTHIRVPPNDGGLALGQAVIAGHAQ